MRYGKVRRQSRPLPSRRSRPRVGRARNWVIRLYDMNADEVFARTGHLVIDSSLGLLPFSEDAASGIGEGRL